MQSTNATLPVSGTPTQLSSSLQQPNISLSGSDDEPHLNGSYDDVAHADLGEGGEGGEEEEMLSGEEETEEGSGSGDGPTDNYSSSSSEDSEEYIPVKQVCTASYFLDRIIPEDYPEEISPDVKHINETIIRLNR